jgi:hypothetical protein
MANKHTPPVPSPHHFPRHRTKPCTPTATCDDTFHHTKFCFALPRSPLAFGLSRWDRYVHVISIHPAPGGAYKASGNPVHTTALGFVPPVKFRSLYSCGRYRRHSWPHTRHTSHALRASCILFTSPGNDCQSAHTCGNACQTVCPADSPCVVSRAPPRWGTTPRICRGKHNAPVQEASVDSV